MSDDKRNIIATFLRPLFSDAMRMDAAFNLPYRDYAGEMADRICKATDEQPTTSDQEAGE